MTQILHWCLYFRLGRGRIVPAKTSGTIRVSDMSNDEGFRISLLTIEEGNFSPVPLRELPQHSELGNFTGKFLRGAPTSWIPKRIGFRLRNWDLQLPSLLSGGGPLGDARDICRFTPRTAYFPFTQAEVVTLGGGAWIGQVFRAICLGRWQKRGSRTNHRPWRISWNSLKWATEGGWFVLAGKLLLCVLGEWCVPAGE